MSPPWLSRTSTMTRRTPWLRASREEARQRRRAVGSRRQPVAEVDDLAALQRRQRWYESSRLAVARADRPASAAASARRRASTRPRRPRPARASASLPSANGTWLCPSHDPEPSEDLGAGEVLRQEPAKPRLVVVRHERPHGLDDLVDRRRRRSQSTRSSDQFAALSERADDVDAVGEVVEPERVDVQAACVLVERSTPRCGRRARPGARPGASRPTTSSSLLSSGAASASSSPPRPGTSRADIVEEVGMADFHRLGELAELALERGRRPRVVGCRRSLREEGRARRSSASSPSQCGTDRHVKSDMSPLTAAQPQTRTVTASRSASKTTSVTSPTSSPSSCSGSGPSQRISIRSWSCSSTSCSLVRPVRT